jgi:hypothetical protein
MDARNRSEVVLLLGVGAIGTAAILCACAAVLGIEDPIVTLVSDTGSSAEGSAEGAIDGPGGPDAEASNGAADVGPETDSRALDSGFFDQEMDRHDTWRDASIDAVEDAPPDASLDSPDSAEGAPGCIGTQNDRANCGRCGNVCSPNEICGGGICGFPVGGTITGLSPGDSIDLRANGGAATTMSSNGPFTLTAVLPANMPYTIAAAISIGSPIPETCSVQNGAGVATTPVSNVNVICIPSDLLYYFPFSGNAKDASGNGNDGVITGNAKPTSDRFGNANAAFNFDGATAIISAPGGLLPLQGASRTMSMWIEPLTAPNMAAIVYWGTNCTANGFGLGVRNLQWPTVWQGCNDYTNMQSLVPTNVWSFLAVVFSSGAPTSYTLYVNNQSYSFQLAQPPITQPAPLMMGRNVTGSYFNGNLDSIRIYGRALTPSEIQGIYTGGGP